MKIKMIYLAAGNSRRFGSNKLYYEIKDRPLFRYGLDALEKVLMQNPETTLTVVTEYDRIREYVLEKKILWNERISVVPSPDSEKGISYSIRAGLADGMADYYLFCVADQPWMQDHTVLQLIRKTTEGGYTGGFVTWNEISGNPAIFSAKLLPQLWSLTGDTGGKKLLQNRNDVCTIQVCTPLEMEDIDDFHKMQTLISQY